MMRLIWLKLFGKCSFCSALFVIASQNDLRAFDNIRAASWENQQCGFRTGPTQTDLYKELEA